MPDAGRYFDTRAPSYDAAYDTPGADGYALRSRLETVLSLAGDGPGEALDAGMGPGRLVAELEDRGWTVSGVDASSEMVAAARGKVPGASERLVQATIESLPFPDATFDAVFATGVLEYAEVEAAILELARVLRPGGLAVVSYPNPRVLYGIWKTRVWYPAVRVTKRVARRPMVFPRGSRTLDPKAFRELLTASGLAGERVEYTSYLVLPTPLDLALPKTAERLGRRLDRSGPQLSRRLAGQLVYAARKLPS